MRSFFEHVRAARWGRNSGRLHVYILANEAVAAMADAHQRLLAGRGVTGLSRQPARFLHMTVEMIRAYADDLAPERMAALVAALGEHVGAVPAFELAVGPALVTRDSIGLDAVPDEPWRRLRRAVRAAAVEALGEEAVPPLAGPGRPHVTTGYALADVDIEPHLGAIHHLRLGRAVLPVGEVHLVAVDQDPVAGVYSWPAPIATLPMARGEKP